MRVNVFLDMTPYILVDTYLVIIYQNIRCHIPEDSSLHSNTTINYNNYKFRENTIFTKRQVEISLLLRYATGPDSDSKIRPKLFLTKPVFFIYNPQMISWSVRRHQVSQPAKR
jgi:hypothetical protein